MWHSLLLVFCASSCTVSQATNISQTIKGYSVAPFGPLQPLRSSKASQNLWVFNALSGHSITEVPHMLSHVPHVVWQTVPYFSSFSLLIWRYILLGPHMQMPEHHMLSLAYVCVFSANCCPAISDCVLASIAPDGHRNMEVENLPCMFELNLL